MSEIHPREQGRHHFGRRGDRRVTTHFIAKGEVRLESLPPKNTMKGRDSNFRMRTKCAICMEALPEQHGDPGPRHGDVETQSKMEIRKSVEDLTHNEKAFQIQEMTKNSHIARGLHLLKECSRKVKQEYTENWSVKKEWSPKNSVQTTFGVL